MPENLVHYDNADMVFIGTVVNIESSTSIIHIIIPRNVTTSVTTFDINSKWKGDLEDSISIEDDYSSSSCGYHFKNNTTYLVFANNKIDDYPQTGLCKGNQIIIDNFKPSLVEYIILEPIYDILFSIGFFIVLSSMIIIISIIIVRKPKPKNHMPI